MMKDMINAIKDAEIRAAQTVEDAENAAVQIAADAKHQAEQIRKDAVKQAKDLAKAGHADDVKAADAVSERFASEIAREAEAQEVLAGAKREDAVQAVMEMILCQ